MYYNLPLQPVTTTSRGRFSGKYGYEDVFDHTVTLIDLEMQMCH